MDQEKADTFGKSLGFSQYAAVERIPFSSVDLVMSCDGVGTKLLIAEELGIYNTVGIDLVAMSANDILAQGGIPHWFMDYYATGELDLDKSNQILDGVKKGCELANCKLVGGETAQLNPMFLRKEWFDLAGFAAGTLRRRFDAERVRIGDRLIGIPSSGLHSNGFTTIRNSYSTWEPWMLEPTRIYVDEMFRNFKYIKAAAHITGGGIHGNLKRITQGRKYTLHFDFSDFWNGILTNTGLTPIKMLNTFNCGWGMILIVEGLNTQLLDIPDAVEIGKIIF